jgi:hypothetical protein
LNDSSVLFEKAGNIGIGQESPANKLNVIGTGNFTTSVITPSLDLGWVNLSAYPSACGGGQFVSTIGDTLTCAAPPDTNITTKCTVNQIQLGSGGCLDPGSVWNITTGNTSAEILAIAVSRTDWTTHDNYPTACTAGQAVSAVGDTLTCVNLPSSTTGNVTGIGTAGYLSKWENGTSLNASGIFEKAGNIGIGQASPANKLNVIGTGNFTTSVITPALDLGWVNLSAYPTACSGGQFVSTIGDTLTCAAPPDTNITTKCTVNQIQLGSGGCLDPGSVWNITTGNTSAEILAVAIARLSNITGAGTQGYFALWSNTTDLNESTVLFEKAGNIGIGQNSPANKLNVIGTINATTSIITPSLDLGWVNLSAYPSACGGGQFISQVGDTLTCAAPPDTNITTKCTVNQIQLGSGGCLDPGSVWNITTGNTSAQILAIAVSRSDWTSIDNYPTACTAGQAVSAVGDTLTCVNLPSSTTGNVTGIGTAGYLSKWENGTSLNASGIFEKAGNIGIGTASPARKLSLVGGNFTISNDTVARSDIYWDGTNNRLVIAVS